MNRVIIVGSGPAAAFCASKLSNFDEVLILEEGDFDGHLTNKASYLSCSIGHSNQIKMAAQVGGASNYWGGSFVKYDRIDFFRRKQSKFNNWPFAYQNLTRFYNEAAEICKVTNPSSFEGPLKNLKEQTIVTQHHPINTKSLLNRPNIKLMTCTKALRLTINENGCPIGLIVQDTTTKQIKEIEADFYVIAAGTINTLRIIHNSFVKSSLPLLPGFGENIGTHPKSNIGSFNAKKVYKKLKFYRSNKDSTVWYQYGLPDGQLEDLNLPNHSIRFEPILVSKLNALKINIANFLIEKSIINSSGKLFDRLRKLSDILINSITRIFIYQRYRIRIYLDHPQETGINISFNTKPDDQLPGIKLIVSDDVLCVKDIQLFCDEFSMNFEMETGQSLVLDKISDENFVVVHSHFTGGIPMCADMKRTGVNTNSELNGTKNVFLSGPAIFPTHSFCNPFMTIAAMSLRLGEHLNDRIKYE